MTDLGDLALHARLSPSLLYRLSTFADKYYAHFNIPKRAGGLRRIAAPSKPLRAVQVWILDTILVNVSVSDYAFAFRKGVNTRANAEAHAANDHFLWLDIEDFFPSIKYDTIVRAFASIGYNWHMAHILANLCTCEGRLPQGGVTSPALSNIVCNRLDRRIAGYAQKHRIAFTRYADDITLSATVPTRLRKTYRMVKHILEDEGFHLNENKTRFAGRGRRRIVTGLVVNPDNREHPVGVSRQQKKELRKRIHMLHTADLAEDERRQLAVQIQGWYAYLKSVDPQRYRQLRTYHTKLLQRLT